MERIFLSDTSENLDSDISLHLLSRAKSHSYKSPLRLVQPSQTMYFRVLNEDGPSKKKFKFTKMQQSSGDLQEDFLVDLELENIEDYKINKFSNTESDLNVHLIKSNSSGHLFLSKSKNLLIQTSQMKKQDVNEDRTSKNKIRKLPPIPFDLEQEFLGIYRLPIINLVLLKNLSFDLICKKRFHIDKTLYLDLDGTLIHKIQRNSDYSNLIIYQDCRRKILVQDIKKQYTKMEIIIRPYAIKFLEILSKEYELIIYTAGGLNYAKESVKELDPKGIHVSQILERSKCLLVNKKIVKDVRLIRNRKIEKSIILDNSITSFYSCINNGIYIKTFEGDCKDDELRKICIFLEKIKGCEDVRTEIKNEFMLEEQLNAFLQKRKKGVSI